MTMHHGHRKRMRERFRQEGLEGFAPHEILELLLFYARARGDVNPLAHKLLDAFGSLKGVLEASPEQLMAVEGVGEETATFLGMMVPVFRKYQECLSDVGATLFRRVDAEKYCQALMAGLRKERLYLICLSSACKVLGRRLLSEGSIDEVPAYPRLVVETALNYNAYFVILCHNHPGGIAEPSAADLDTTLLLEAVLKHLGMCLIDHIIVAGNSTYSMNQHGKLRYSSLRPVKGGGCFREEEQVYVRLDEGELE